MTTHSAFCDPSRIRAGGGSGSRRYQPGPLMSRGVCSALCTPMRRSVDGLGRSRIRDIGPDRLQLGVLIVGMQRLVAATEAGELEAAERRRDVAFSVAVDRHRTG